MKKFWPHRAEAKGFSFQNFALKYRLKISNSSISTNEISNQIHNDGTSISTNEEVKKISITHQSAKRTHWANRDFSEYKDAA